MRRLKIFVDFWNVLINARSQTSSVFKIDIEWDLLASHLVGETKGATQDESNGDLAGCYVFGSFGASDPRDKKLVDETLQRHGSSPGLYFDFKQRINKETSIKCKDCGKPVSVSSESGVDVSLAIEMIKHAAMREHNYLALVSGDRDFLPLLTYLRDQGQRVLHVSTGAPQIEMRSLTWKQVDLRPVYPSICRIVHDDLIVFTRVGYEAKVEEALSLAKLAGIKGRVVDVDDKKAISDKDFGFLIKNLRYFGFSRKNKRNYFGGPNLLENIALLRKELISGDVVGAFPFVVRNGFLEAYGNDHHNWMIVASMKTPGAPEPLEWRRFQTGIEFR